MSNINVVRKNLGPVTAYKYAVQQGYTGTEQEFAALMASYATVAEEASESAASAASSAAAAEDAADRAEEAARTLTIDDTLTESGQAADSKAVGDKLTDLKEELSDTDRNVDTLGDIVTKDEIITGITWTSNKGLIADSTDQYFGGFVNSSIVDVSSFVTIPSEVIAIKSLFPIYQNTTTFGFVFYDSSYEPIKGYVCDAKDSYGSETKLFWVPENAKYFRTIWFHDTVTYGSFSAFFSYDEIADLAEITSLGEIENITFPNTGKGVIAVSTNPDYGKLANSGMLNSTDYIPVGICSCILANLPYYASSTTFGFVFYDKDKNPINGYTLNAYGAYGIETRKFSVPINAKYFRTSGLADASTYGEMSLYRIFDTDSKPYVYVAASNSSDSDKESADYICDGVNDEREIQSAVNASSNTVILAIGDYYIDAFQNTEGYGVHSAVHFGANGQQNIIVKGAGFGASRKAGTTNELFGGAILHITDSCYNSLDDNTQYAVFASVSNGANRKYPWSKIKIENIGIIIPDNQKKIICIDGWMMSSLSINNIYAIAVADTSNLKVPVDGCIGIRGMQGSNFGINNRWESSFVWGFYEGYAVSGEHLIGVDLGSRYCNYGFTFNRKTNTVGAWIHPITMINCCDECNFNLPVFGNSGESGKTDGLSGRQTINLIDYNLEWLAQYSALGGNLATELNAGQTYGSISFTMQKTYGGNSKNVVDASFWASGYGHNMKTVNSAHSASGTSAERLTYTPQYMQQYYDTDLNKLLIYDDANWVDVLGNSI